MIDDDVKLVAIFTSVGLSCTKALQKKNTGLNSHQTLHLSDYENN